MNNRENYEPDYSSQSNEFRNNGNSGNFNDLNNINQGLNNIVRRDLKTRGLVNSYSSPFQQNQQRESEKKAAILDNIKQQINMDNKKKTDDVENKKREDEKYLSAMENNYPFGK